MTNEQLQKELARVQGTTSTPVSCEARFPIPSELQPGSTASREERKKILDLYVGRITDEPANTWTEAQKALIKEQCNIAAGSL